MKAQPGEPPSSRNLILHNPFPVGQNICPDRKTDTTHDNQKNGGDIYDRIIHIPHKAVTSQYIDSRITKCRNGMKYCIPYPFYRSKFRHELERVQKCTDSFYKKSSFQHPDDHGYHTSRRFHIVAFLYYNTLPDRDPSLQNKKKRCHTRNDSQSANLDQ